MQAYASEETYAASQTISNSSHPRMHLSHCGVVQACGPWRSESQDCSSALLRAVLVLTALQDCQAFEADCVTIDPDWQQLVAVIWVYCRLSWLCTRWECLCGGCTACRAERTPPVHINSQLVMPGPHPGTQSYVQSSGRLLGEADARQLHSCPQMRQRNQRCKVTSHLGVTAHLRCGSLQPEGLQWLTDAPCVGYNRGLKQLWGLLP